MAIQYEGIKSVTVSEILDRFKERKVGLSVESQYDPNKVQRATVVLKEYLAERGRQYATVDPQIRQIPPSSLEVTFNVNEGPKVKVGDIKILGEVVPESAERLRDGDYTQTRHWGTTLTRALMRDTMWRRERAIRCR